jgi:prepilin-type N-terminal cleavage/methylation domain-containing protein
MALRRHLDSGFTLVEVMIVSALIAILSGVAVSLMGDWLPKVRADAVMRQVVFQLSAARELAVTQRREIEVQIVGNNTLQIIRHENAPTPDTVLRVVPLEYGVVFTLFAGLPDTPDSFGNAAPVDFGGADELTFNSEGSMADSQDVPVSGTIFMGQTAHKQSARAVTVFGGTGRVRGYRWIGSRWEQ